MKKNKNIDGIGNVKHIHDLSHMLASKKILRYLKATIDYDLMAHGNSTMSSQ